MLTVRISADIFVKLLLGQNFCKSLIKVVEVSSPRNGTGDRSVPERHYKTMSLATESFLFGQSDTIRIRLEDNADNHLSPTSVRARLRVGNFPSSVRIDFAETAVAPCSVRVEVITDLKVICLITFHFIRKNNL